MSVAALGCCVPHLSVCVLKSLVTMMKERNCTRNKDTCWSLLFAGNFSSTGRLLITNVSPRQPRSCFFCFQYHMSIFFFLKARNGAAAVSTVHFSQSRLLLIIKIVKCAQRGHLVGDFYSIFSRFIDKIWPNMKVRKTQQCGCTFDGMS